MVAEMWLGVVEVAAGGGEINSKEELQRKPRLECPSLKLFVRPRLNMYYSSNTNLSKMPGILEVTRSLLDSDHGEEALLESYTRNLHAIGEHHADDATLWQHLAMAVKY